LWCSVEWEVLDVLGQEQLGKHDLIRGRAHLLLRDLGLQQVVANALRFALPKHRCDSLRDDRPCSATLCLLQKTKP